MVPRLTKGGRSFKGAALYYLHDKRQDGERVRLTSERVSWTEVRNLPTESAERAWRMMADTASQQSVLKASAGIKATGRKLENPVLAYSLSWHPDEKPDRAEMIRAAEASMKALGLEDHQTVLVAHHDEPHPHVHILVNRVHPIDGRAAPLSRSKLVLSEWAEAYEKAQGRVLCEERVKNNAQRQLRRDFDRAVPDRTPRERPAPERTPRRDFQRAANENRGAYDARRAADRAARTNRQKAQSLRLAQAAKDRELSAKSRAIYARHRQQWQDLQKAHKDRKADIARQREAAVIAAIAEVKARQKGDWRAFYADQRKAERGFWRNEKSTLGKAWNMLRLAAETPVSKQGKEHRGQLSRVFNIIVSQKGRHDALKAVQEADKQLRSERSIESIRSTAKHTRDSFKDHYQRGWTQFQTDRAALIEQQEADRQGIKDSWKALRAEKAKEWQTFREEEDALTQRLGGDFRKARGEEHDREEEEGRSRGREFPRKPPKPPGGSRF